MKTSLTVKNWEKFQHYKDRNPPWIKLSTSTFQDYEFGKLHDASKLLAVCIWTLASRSKDGQVPYDFEWIKSQCNLSSVVKLDNLKELIKHGFIIDASEMLAECKQVAIPETYSEYSKEAYSKEAETDTRASFEEIWEIFPRQRRGGKENTYKAYLKALSKTTKEKVYDGVQAYRHSDEVSRGYGKGAAAWLNDERWENDYRVIPSSGHSSEPSTAAKHLVALHRA